MTPDAEISAWTVPLRGVRAARIVHRLRPGAPRALPRRYPRGAHRARGERGAAGAYAPRTRMNIGDS